MLNMSGVQAVLMSGWILSFDDGMVIHRSLIVGWGKGGMHQYFPFQ